MQQAGLVERQGQRGMADPEPEDPTLAFSARAPEREGAPALFHQARIVPQHNAQFVSHNG